MLSKSKINTIFCLVKYVIAILIIYIFSLRLVSYFQREGFKAFDQCKNMGYPFNFCINIPFNSESLYKSWNELEKQEFYPEDREL